MQRVLLSTTYLGSIYYFAIISQAKDIIIEKHEHYTKQSYRNRCTIYAANGKLDLTIPVVKNSGQKTRITDIEISYQENWIRNHWQSIISAYNSSPFFEYYIDEFEAIYKSKPQYLFEFNTELQNICLDILGISNKISFSEIYETIPNSVDFRYSISPKIEIDNNLFNPYHQVFEEKHGFIHNLSILDLIFNEGTNALNYLKNIKLIL